MSALTLPLLLGVLLLPAAGSAKAPEAAMKVSLLEPGAEPRSPLRCPAGGPSRPQTGWFRFDYQADIRSHGQEPRLTPQYTTALRIESRPASGKGGGTTWRVLESRFEPESAVPEEGRRRALALARSLVGSRFRIESSRSGQLSRVLALPGAGADPELEEMTRQMIEQHKRLATPFPADPVGVGAVWEVQLPLKRKGSGNLYRVRYRLAARQDSQVEILASADRTLGPADFPEHLNEKIRASGFNLEQRFRLEGRVEQDLAWAEARRIELKVVLEQRFEQGGKAQEGNGQVVSTTNLGWTADEPVRPATAP